MVLENLENNLWFDWFRFEIEVEVDSWVDIQFQGDSGRSWPV